MQRIRITNFGMSGAKFLDKILFIAAQIKRRIDILKEFKTFQLNSSKLNI